MKYIMNLANGMYCQNIVRKSDEGKCNMAHKNKVRRVK